MEVKSKNLNADISQLNQEIDYIIYQLYDLTDEEVSIIENAV